MAESFKRLVYYTTAVVISMGRFPEDKATIVLAPRSTGKSPFTFERQTFSDTVLPLLSVTFSTLGNLDGDESSP